MKKRATWSKSKMLFQEARSTILGFLLFTAIIIFWVATYTSSLPNELDDVTALEIRHICNDLTGSVICDPESILSNKERSKIQYAMNQMENDFERKYNSASTTSSITDNNEVEVQMAIVLMENVRLQIFLTAHFKKSKN